MNCYLFVPAPFIDEIRDEPSPPGLMRSTQTATGISVKMLIEKNEILKVRVILKKVIIAIDRAFALWTLFEELNHGMGKVGSHIMGVLSVNCNEITGMCMEVFESLDEEKGSGKPEGPSPI